MKKQTVVLAVILALAFVFLICTLLLFLHHKPDKEAPLAGVVGGSGNIQVEVVSLLNYDPGVWAKVFGIDESRMSKLVGEPCLFVRLKIKNRSKTAKMDYTSWSQTITGLPTLKDEHNNFYQRGKFKDPADDLRTLIQFPKFHSTKSIHPGEVSEDVLVFERIVSQSTMLTLTLPAEVFHEEGQLEIKIPVSFLIECWVKRLQGTYQRDRLLAAAMLGHMGPSAKSAVPSLVRATDDSDTEVAKASSDALLEIDSATWERIKLQKEEALEKARQAQLERERLKQQRLKREQEAEREREKTELEAKERREKADRDARARKEEAEREAKAQSEALDREVKRREEERQRREAKSIAEKRAAEQLAEVKKEHRLQNWQKAVIKCQVLIGKHPDTKAGEEAKRLLKKLMEGLQKDKNNTVAMARLKLLERLVGAAEIALDQNDEGKADMLLYRARIRLKRLLNDYPDVETAKDVKELLDKVLALRKKHFKDDK